MHIYTIIGSEISYIGGNFKNDKPLLAANKAGKTLFKKLEDVKYVKYKNKKSIKFILKNKKDKKNYCYEVFKKKNKKEFNYEIKECVLSKNQLKKYIGGVGGVDSNTSSDKSSSYQDSTNLTPEQQRLDKLIEKNEIDALKEMENKGYSQIKLPPPFPYSSKKYKNRIWQHGLGEKGTWLWYKEGYYSGTNPVALIPPLPHSSWNVYYIDKYFKLPKKSKSKPEYDPNESDSEQSEDKVRKRSRTITPEPDSRNSTPTRRGEGPGQQPPNTDHKSGSSGGGSKKTLDKNLLKIPKEIMW
jgi:hypothetical protein